MQFEKLIILFNSWILNEMKFVKTTVSFLIAKLVECDRSAINAIQA